MFISRFKKTPFHTEENVNTARQHILNQVQELFPNEREGSSTAASTAATEDEPPKQTGFWSHYAQVFSQPEPITDESGPVQAADKELDSYLNERTFDPKHEEASSYWNVSSYKHLKKVAYKYLCIPPCTVFSERLFSVAGNICDSKRNRLDPERIKMLVFLNRNID